jgi:hypothetical protein
MLDEDSLRKRQAAILPHLDERQRRLFAAAEAKAAGYGGTAALSRVTRIAASAIGRGLKDLEAPALPSPGAVRRPGGGRKSLSAANPRLLEDLNGLVEPSARGDPMSPLRWTCNSLRRLAAELKKLGQPISHTGVGELLKKQKFSLQANRKTLEGADNPDRGAQFHFINDAVQAALAENQPVICVDTKKKERVGGFNNAGREWRPQGEPEDVRAHDFPIRDLGRAAPYGIYDLAANTGWANVGVDNDTAAFAVQTIRRRRQDVGGVRYPLAKRPLITADGGGGGGSRVSLWRRELQRLADDLGVSIEARHLPPGTSKWNKIERRLFSPRIIVRGWRAKPLVSYRVVVDLIAAAATESGLKVYCELDASDYPKGAVVSDDEMPASTSNAPISMANGITPSRPPIKRKRPFPDEPQAVGR